MVNQTGKLKNLQLLTKWKDKDQKRLITVLEEGELKSPKSGEILVEMLYVPTHGSFWLATHPDLIHPRSDEFMQNGYFVFGNGGVGRVVSLAKGVNSVDIGDYVCIFGHSPCDHSDCYSCQDLERYIECEYGEGKIVGHGKGANDGTFAEYVMLPHESWEKCYSKNDSPTRKQLLPLMFAYLVADVRNALTRNPNYLKARNILLIGGGNSGHIAVSLILNDIPNARILVLEPDEERAASIRTINEEAIDALVVPPDIVEASDSKNSSDIGSVKLKRFVRRLTSKVSQHFNDKKCDFLMDCSSRDASKLWANERILSPGVICILFGFGIRKLSLGEELLKLSGMTIQVSRGVGDSWNREETIKYIKSGGDEFIRKYLINRSEYFKSLRDFEMYITSYHDSLKPLDEMGQAYVSPVPL